MSSNAGASKIKKDAKGSLPTLDFAENPDILATVSRLTSGRPKLVVGFAAETDDVLAHATAKRARKGCDWIVANDVSPATGIMGGTENAVTVISADGADAGRGWTRTPWRCGWRRRSPRRWRDGGRPLPQAGRPAGAMPLVVIRVQREDWADASVPLPDYATAGAAGADLRLNLAAEDRAAGFALAPMQRRIVPTGLRVEIPQGFEMQIRPRSGLALKLGLSLPNTPGTIDSDYRGPLGVLLINLGTAAVTLAHGERIAQAVVAPVVQARFVVSEVLEVTARGEGGFGSTGRG